MEAASLRFFEKPRRGQQRGFRCISSDCRAGFAGALVRSDAVGLPRPCRTRRGAMAGLGGWGV
jgi:hypothetical protein